MESKEVWSPTQRHIVAASFLGWMLDKGEGMTQALSYAPLPNDVVAAEKAAIGKLK